MNLTNQDVYRITCEEHIWRSARTNIVFCGADCVAILREPIAWEAKR